MESGLQPVDWAIVAAYVAFAVALGLVFRRRAAAGVDSFFVADRRLPWWLAGTSMVATTFAADTPLAVTGIVATGGIAGNWIWWSWALAHLSATFFFARLWRRSRVITDAEIVELRYGGRPAAVLRGFKAVYSGIFLNCLTMAWVIAAMVKISRAFFDVPPAAVIAACILVSVVYTSLGGIRGVVVTDLVQFGLGMLGAIVLAVIVVVQFGGIRGGDGAGGGLLPALAATLESEGRGLEEVLAFVPGADHPTTPLVYFFALLLFGWWKWAEGNGYIVQRLATARDEGHAQRAQLWFTVVHNAVRPWPWIVVALAALVLYPSLAAAPPASLSAAGPAGTVTVAPGLLDVATGGTLRVTGAGPGWRARVLGVERPLEPGADGGHTVHFARLPASARTALTLLPPDAPPVAVEGLVVQLTDREMAYPLLMRRYLPPGLLGLVVASLLAAFMSTIDTHVNWGASYLVQDVYRRFLRPAAGARECILVSRAAIVLMALLAGGAALLVHNIAEVWLFLITLGAGLGSVSVARWYWWRVTAWAELAAIAVSTVMAIGLLAFCTPTLFGGPNPWFLFEVPRWVQIPALALASLAVWLPVAVWGPPNAEESLRRFARRVRPPGPGWERFRDGRPAPRLAPLAGRFLAGLALVFGALFGLGYLVLGPRAPGVALVAAAVVLWRWLWRAPGGSRA